MIPLKANHLENPHKDLLKSFKIPVLVNHCMNYVRVEYLLGLVREQITEVLHLVQLVVV